MSGLTPCGIDPVRTSATLARLIVLVAISFALASPGAPSLAYQDGGTPPAGDADATLPCFDGRLRLRDLEHADPSIPEGLDRVYALGAAWEDDAILYSLRLGCPLLEPGYQWEGTFFSATAQAFYETDTSEILPAEDDPSTIKRLGTDGLQVHFVYRSLVRAGFDANSLLSAGSGVTVRYNTEAHKFGPPTAPTDDVYFHVAIEERGEVVDVWVASKDGTIYRYGAE